MLVRTGIGLPNALGEIARATGRQIRYSPLSAVEFASALAEEGLPGDEVTAYTELFTQVLDGRSAYLANGVQRALGREPRDFADHARDTAAAGVWRG